MDQPEAADVEAAAAGDELAFERLVKATQGPVWRYLVHLVGDASQAEDLTQEVFVRAYRKLATLRNPAGFVSWLMVVARNAAYDAGRSKLRRPLELVPDPESLAPATNPDPHLSLEVQDALSNLDSDLREAIVLVGVVGLTYRETGQILEIPEGTVKSRVFRARKALIDLLESSDDI